MVRIFNTYGPRMHPYDGRVVTNFIVQALRGEDITLYGGGAQTRSFCYCDDLVDVIMAHMNNEPASGDLRDAFVGPVNIGNPGEFTIKQLAEKVIDLTGSKSKMVDLPLPKDDPLQRKPDISLAKKELGWEPKVNLDEGLKRTIAYFRSVDLDSFRKPTDHDAHKSSKCIEGVTGRALLVGCGSAFRGGPGGGPPGPPRNAEAYPRRRGPAPAGRAVWPWVTGWSRGPAEGRGGFGR